MAFYSCSSYRRVTEAICLVRELDVPEILPAAFYALGIQRWGNESDGGRSHLILSPDDLRRLIVGLEMLQERIGTHARRTGVLTSVTYASLSICLGCQSG